MRRTLFTLLRIAAGLAIIVAALGIVAGAAVWLSQQEGAEGAGLALVGVAMAVNFGGIWAATAVLKAIDRLEGYFARRYLNEINRRALDRMLMLVLFALSASACSIHDLTGVPVERRPWCNVKIASAGNADSPTQELGAVYRPEPCQPWHTDTIGWARP